MIIPNCTCKNINMITIAVLFEFLLNGLDQKTWAEKIGPSTQDAFWVRWNNNKRNIWSMRWGLSWLDFMQMLFKGPTLCYNELLGVLWYFFIENIGNLNCYLMSCFIRKNWCVFISEISYDHTLHYKLRNSWYRIILIANYYQFVTTLLEIYSY